MSNKNSMDDFKEVMESVISMDSKEFKNTLEEEKKKMLDLQKQYPNNPLFSQMTGGDFDISKEEFVSMCKMILTGNMSDTLSEAFKFMQGDTENEEETEGSAPKEIIDDDDNDNIEG